MSKTKKDEINKEDLSKGESKISLEGMISQEENDDHKNELLDARWLNNEDIEVEKVFGFNDNAELVNSRAAMIGFLMLIITELVFKGKPVTLSIFGIG